jgi:uncharacterized repeat protein (TIGR02543 family)
MNTKERNRKIALLSIVVAVAVIVSCALGIFIDVALPKEYKEPSISIDKTAGSAIAVDYPDPSGLGQFKNGFKYVYTDKDKVDGFRAGTEQYDVSTQEVNTSMPRGSKENPYVIASVGDWEKFAKMVGPTTSTRGLNEYFVLAADLDFSGVTFRPIPRFAGNFHGLGFTLSNINCSSWVYWNGSSWVAFGTTTSAGFGVFGRTDSATITDLILQDYYFTGMPNTESLTWSNYQGGLVGTICGNDSILNCHLQGEIDGGNNSYPNYGWSGPIVAFLYKATSSDTNVIIYRCTANTVMSISPNAEKNFHTGGIIGDSNNGVNLKISDCTSYFNFTNNTGYGHTGGIMGYMRESGRVSVENIVSTYYYSGRYIAGGGICALHTNTNNLKLIKNTYVHAAKGGVGSTGAMNAAEAAPQSSSNLHFGPYVNTTPITSPVPTKHSSVSALFDAAKNSVGSGTDKLPEQIWDREKITEEVTPDTSPVRNYLVATLTFKNLLSGGNEEGVGLDDADFMPGEELPKPEASYLADKEAAHHVFKGWTLDASGNSEPFNALPTGVFAEQTVYAVWGVDTKETTDITATGGTSSGSYSASAVYGDTIKLQSSVSVSVMTDMQYTLQWKLNGDEVKTAKAKSYTVRNVKESGDYTFDYVFYSQGEPLWRGKGTSSQTYDAEITPAPLKLKSFDTTKTGYKGMSYSDSAFKPKPVIVMQSDESVVVDGTSEWTIAMGIVGGGVQESVNGDKITKNFKFTPDEKYNGNYGSSVFFDGTYTMQYVKMIFKIPSLNNETMEVDLIYNDPLTYKNVVDLFQDEFKKYMLDPNYSGLFVGMTPAFVKDGNKININDYKKQSGNAYAAVTSNIEIEVGFVTGEYTVSFDPANGGSVTTLPDKVKYNVKLTAPTEPSNGDKLFMGWYYDTGEVDEKNNAIMKKWDFDEDRVTGDLALVASWLEADTLKSLTVTLTGKRPLIAGMKLSGDDLKVMANFIGTVNGETIEQSMELTWSEYGKSLQYDSRSWDGNLHLYADGSDSTIIDAVNLVKISYTFTNKKGETSNAEYTLSVTVLPIDKTEELHDVKNINLGQDADNNVVMEVDGTPKNLPELPKSQYSKFNVKNITYEYRDYTGQILQPEDVIEAGRYTVRVIFEMASPDYHADVLIIYLTLGELSNIRIEWEYDASQPLVYNGQAQTPDFKIYDENNNDVTDQLKDKLTFSGDYDKTDVGEYTFSVAISGDYKIESGATCSYKIAKAILNIPTLKADGEIIYDGMPKSVADFLDGFDSNLMKVQSGGTGTNADSYTAIIELPDLKNCEWSGVSGKTVTLEWEIGKAHLTAVWSGYKHVADGVEFQPKVTSFVGLAEVDVNAVNYDTDVTYSGDLGKKEVGAYSITAVLNASAQWASNYVLDTNVTRPYAIIPQEGVQVITIEWDENDLVFNGKVQMPAYKVYDENGNDITEQIKGILTFGGDYDKSKWADDYTLTVNQPESGYYIMSGMTCDYTIVIDANGNGYNPNPDEEEKDKDGFNFDSVGQMLKEWWQVIASGISIVLIIIFVAKTISYVGRKKEAKRTAEEKYKSYYAAATGLFGLAMNIWTAIACVLMGLAVVTFAVMLVAKKQCKKAERELADSKEEYERNRAEAEARRRDEDMKMMFMHMMGGGNGGQGMPQGAFVQQGLGAEEMRGLISETVTALLPGMQQMLPQQASNNDELVNKLIEQNEKLMQKLAEQPERVVEKEVIASNANDELVNRLIEQNERLMQDSAKNQEVMQALMQKLADQPAQQIVQPQIIEKIVEKPVEKIVEKEVRVEVPVETVVEKVVEKPIVISTEAVGEAEKSKQVKKTPTPKKAPSPRLTLEEAYAKLTKEQKKYFDGLREYAMSKDSKCKEKLSTYFTTIGPSTTNPFIKLTIKKGITVALFKMEDEYLKDIRRNASSDGTKMKIKETELPVGDKQAYDTAKDMVDLRVDQIDRYNDFLKEQRALRK